MELSERHYREVLAPRGISEEVAIRDRYLSYTPEDIRTLRLLPEFGSAQKKSARTREVQRSGGLLIVREGWIPAQWIEGSFDPVPRPVWQLRPDLPPDDGRRYVNLEGYAKGIDIHPAARKGLKRNMERSVTFLMLEGSLKADAGYSQGWQTLNVPGVTQWKSRDLRYIGPKLRESPILFVVTDSDWEFNQSVSLQANLCVEYLRANGIRAIHVAPRLLCPQDHEHSKTCKTGIDDAIASSSWDALTDLLVVPRLPQFAPASLSLAGRTTFSWLLSKHRQLVVSYPAAIKNDTDLSKSQVRHATEELMLEGLVAVKHGQRYRDPESGDFDANPNQYAIIQRALPLSELGWDSPEKLERIPRLTPKIGAHLGSLAARTLSADPGPDVLRTCDWCGRPNNRRKGARFCGDRCRINSFRGRVAPKPEVPARELAPEGTCVLCDRFGPHEEAHLSNWAARGSPWA